MVIKNGGVKMAQKKEAPQKREASHSKTILQRGNFVCKHKDIGIYMLRSHLKEMSNSIKEIPTITETEMSMPGVYRTKKIRRKPLGISKLFFSFFGASS